ncbi:MAG: TVP38/TMEM64 family protein [Desulfobulbaceae bacterium]|nr:TVP38/TMEM64 family protein [Desulfobulbaceae bacterium]HIJ78486.1 TVP38/TMEM64 family protein [Deltaproteobacteria bacterium]
MTRFLKRRAVYLILLLAALGGIIIYAMQENGLLYQAIFHLKNGMDKGEQLRAAILAQGMLAPFLLIGLQVLQVIIAPIPGEASGALGGYLFGAWPSFFYSTIGLTIGSWLAFAIGRLLSDLVRSRLEKSKIYLKFNHLVEKGDFIIPFILFLLPGFPKDSLSYMLGMSHMPLPVFLFVAAVGRMPGTLMLSFQGAEIYQGNYLRLALLLFLSALIAIPCAIYRKQIMLKLTHLSKRTFDDQDGVTMDNPPKP